jgi:hypothetical protein
MYFVPKQGSGGEALNLGRFRRHAPTMAGYPAAFESDWCGDHKLDENRLSKRPSFEDSMLAQAMARRLKVNEQAD